jgi:REP element-mobilizing transposase RayT
MGPRHPSFDYRRVAAYFVTTCARNRRCLFGTVSQGQMHRNEVGTIVAEEWVRSERLRDRILLDAWVVMPNHLHGIVCIVPPGVDDVSPRGYDVRVGSAPETITAPRDDHVGPTRASDLHAGRMDGSEESRSPNGPSSRSLSAMIGAFKSAATRRANREHGVSGSIWQSGFHDRILRNEEEWRARRRYIERNPGRWAQDPLRS